MGGVRGTLAGTHDLQEVMYLCMSVTMLGYQYLTFHRKYVLSLLDWVARGVHAQVINLHLVA